MATLSEQDAYQSDLAKILEALGLNSSARPISCHEVVQQEVLPEIARLKALMSQMQHAFDACDWSGDRAQEPDVQKNLEAVFYGSTSDTVGEWMYLREDGAKGKERAGIRQRMLERVAEIERDGVILSGSSEFMPEGNHARPLSLAARMQVKALRDFAATLGEA